MYGTSFEIFGVVHLLTIAIVILVSTLLPKFYQKKSDGQKLIMTRIIIAVLAFHLISSPYKDLYILENPYHWVEVLPLHMCDLSEIFLVLFLLGGPRILYTCAFFWGLGGATMAILTPDISYYDLDYIYFMVGHGMIVVAIMYATIALGNRPYAKDILKVTAITAFILLPNIYLINDLLGEPANYWYLQAKPDGASLMDMFPDPPHSLFYTVPLSVAVFYLIYLPYFFKDRVSK